MQIVIDIPDRIYKIVQNRMLNITDDEILENALKNGTPLPKGHGRLIDESKILEQEPVLDKIRAEIEQLDYNLESVDYDHNGMAMTEEVHMICQEEVLQIIDKYKSESEDKE